MDQERIYSKFDEMEGYLEELENIKPLKLSVYKRSIKDKRACERLLQISIECILDICNIIVSKYRLGLPTEENDIFIKMNEKNIISKNIMNLIINMKGLRNILVHRYGIVKDEIIFEIISDKLDDFDKIKVEIVNNLKNHSY